jgi:hypothetical protein
LYTHFFLWTPFRLFPLYHVYSFFPITIKFPFCYGVPFWSFSSNTAVCYRINVNASHIFRHTDREKRCRCQILTHSDLAVPRKRTIFFKKRHKESKFWYMNGHEHE